VTRSPLWGMRMHPWCGDGHAGSHRHAPRTCQPEYARTGMAFNTRIWLAEQRHCDPESLTLEVTQDRGGSDEEAVYRQAGARAGRVVISGTPANLGGHERRLVTAYLSAGRRAYVHVASDERVIW
jgi:hypothetical protein